MVRAGYYEHKLGMLVYSRLLRQRRKINLGFYKSSYLRLDPAICTFTRQSSNREFGPCYTQPKHDNIFNNNIYFGISSSPYYEYYSIKDFFCGLDLSYFYDTFITMSFLRLA